MGGRWCERSGALVGQWEESCIAGGGGRGGCSGAAAGRRRGGGHLALVWRCPHWWPYITTAFARFVIAIGMLKMSGEPKWGVPQEKGSRIGLAAG